MDVAVIVGSIAAVASVSSFAPQAWKILRTRETKDLSLPMWILEVAAFALWTGYGVLLAKWPIVVPNALCLILSAFILTMKLLPRRKRDAVADAIAPR